MTGRQGGTDHLIAGRQPSDGIVVTLTTSDDVLIYKALGLQTFQKPHLPVLKPVFESSIYPSFHFSFFRPPAGHLLYIPYFHFSTPNRKEEQKKSQDAALPRHHLFRRRRHRLRHAPGSHPRRPPEPEPPGPERRLLRCQHQPQAGLLHGRQRPSRTMRAWRKQLWLGTQLRGPERLDLRQQRHRARQVALPC